MLKTLGAARRRAGRLRLICLFFCVCRILSGCATISGTPEKRETAARPAIESRVSGVFIAPKLAPEATYQQWRGALLDMKEIGIDTVIIQYSCRCDPNRGNQAYFPYGEADNDGDPLRRKQIGRILSAASQLEMEVYLGLQIAEEEWFRRDLYREPQWLREQCLLSARLADALWESFGETFGECVSGWYLPFEFESSEEYHPFYQQITREYYAPLTEKLKSHSEYGDRKIMVSPIMCGTDDLWVWEDAVGTILRGSKIDVFAPQDGIGYGTQTHDTVDAWYRSSRQAVDAAKRETGRDIALWANCENYARLQNPEEPDTIERRKPMAIGKFLKSLDLAVRYADKLITFSIHRWDVSLTGSSDAEVNRSYLEAYRRYAASGSRPTGIAEGYYVNIRPVEADTTLTMNPYARGGLTDGPAPDPDDWDSYRGIASSDGQPFTMEIRFDDPAAVSRVVSVYHADASAAIGLPEKVRYEYFVRSGENWDVLTYTRFYEDTFTDGMGKSVAQLDTPTVADGIRVTVFPGSKWTFLDDIWVE